MLTKPPKVGDEVLLVASCNSKTRYFVIVTKVTKQRIYCDGEAFTHEGKHLSNFPSCELWEDHKSYDDKERKEKLIALVKRKASSWAFGDEISVENLEKILELME